MDKLKIRVNTREVLGKKVKMLRRKGITPAHIYGSRVKSLPLQVDTHSLEDILRRAGSTSLISLFIDDAKRSHKVMIADVQRDAISDELIHVDFQQVRMTHAVTVEVPLRFVGESPVAKSATVKLLKNMMAVSVECMPDNIPSSIDVDISHLDEANPTICVKDVDMPDGAKAVTNAESLVIKVYKPRLEVEETEAIEGAAEVTEAEEVEQKEESEKTSD
ncbi:MAG: 50S ribosomal protein L25 [Dehalococcoidia bacterium]|nr:50S ribosomal protein L25 [Dehalococcoidia bacterium]